MTPSRSDRTAAEDPAGTLGATGAASRTEAILELVDAIPRGKVMTYGDVARALGIPSARIVGGVLSRSGGTVAWHRVVLADGRVAPHLAARQLAALEGEGVAVRGGRVALGSARWRPGAGDAGELGGARLSPPPSP